MMTLMLVMMMFRDIEFRRQMALRAEPIALLAERQTVWLMTIGAGDAGSMHTALQDGAVIIDLIALLAVRMIEVRSEQ